MEIASHAIRKYRCRICDGRFTRHSSLVRHQSGDTACKGDWRANGASSLGSSSGVQSVFHASAREPSRIPYSAQDDISLVGSSTGPAPGNWQPSVPVFNPSSPTDLQNASRRKSADVPSQSQDVAITRSPLSPPLELIDSLMPDEFAEFINYDECLLP